MIEFNFVNKKRLKRIAGLWFLTFDGDHKEFVIDKYSREAIKLMWIRQHLPYYRFMIRIK
jgi:hypothetical protein